MPVSLRRAADLATEKGSSTWLTALPLAEHGFALHKGAFHDALALRYGWAPSEMPSKCACGNNLSVEHALSCAKGGFPSIRHNEIRDLTATLLTEVCHDVCIEPGLQPISNEILTGATTNTHTHLFMSYYSHPVTGSTSRRRSECTHNGAEVEHASFTPLVISATGGLAKEATIFYKRLASMLASKWDTPYSSTLCWLRCRLAFSLLRSAIQLIRGARSS